MDNRRGLFVVVALAVVARFVLVAAGGGIAGVEAFEYDDLARNLLAGRGYVHHHLGTEYRAFYSGVLYVMLLAAGYAVSHGSVVAAVVLQAAAAAGLAAVAFAIANRLAGMTAAWFAGVLVALHPGLVLYDTHKIHPLSFDALAIAVAVLTLLRLRDRMDTRAAVVAGVAFGVALLQRGTMLLVPAAAAIWLASVEPRVRDRFFRLGVAYALGAMIVVAPWVGRNWVVLGTPTLSTVGAESLWRGNAPHSSGASYLSSGRTVLEAAPAVRESLRGRTELQQAALFQALALNDALQQPPAFAGRIARKVATFWSFGPVSGLLYPTAYLYIYVAYYIGVVALAAVGAWHVVSGKARGRGARGTLALIVAVGVCVSLVQSLFYVEVRHRWGVESLLLVVTAVALARAWEAARGATPALAEARR